MDGNALRNRRRAKIGCLCVLMGMASFAGCSFNRTADGKLFGWWRSSHTPVASAPAEDSAQAAATTSAPGTAEVVAAPGSPSGSLAATPPSLSPEGSPAAPQSNLLPQTPAGVIAGAGLSPPVWSAPPPTFPPVQLVSGETVSSPAQAVAPSNRLLEVARAEPRTSGARTVLHADERTFEQHVLRSEGPVLVDFYAIWCGPCKRLTPTLEEVAAESPDARIVKVDIDASPGLAARYGVKSVPSLMVFKDGQVVAKQQGVLSKTRVKSLLAL